MSRLRNTIVANFGGQGWAVLLNVAFVPFYIRVLGIEAFGLISFMLSLQALSQLFDFGIGGAINRELSQRAHVGGDDQGTRDLVRTTEVIVWGLSLAIGLLICLCSTAIATLWLHPRDLSPSDTATAVVGMGVAVAALWPTTFYSSALSGLEMQARLNVITAVFGTLRSGGVLIVLWLVAPTIHVFFWWHAAVGVTQSLALAATLWRSLPRGTGMPTFDLGALKGARRFAGGLFAISALSLFLTQLDRLALSSLRPLEDLGYYGLALSVSAGLGRMVQPMFNALYPRFSRLVAAGRTVQLAELYHLSNQCLVIVIAPICLVLVLFSRDVLFLWTGDTALAARVAPALTVLAAGSALNGLMNLPYALQLAYGQTRLTIVSNLIALGLAIPYCLWAVPRLGLVGAASIWLAINAGFVAITATLAHRRLMPGRLRAWYLEDILPSALAAALVVGIARFSGLELSRDFRGFALIAVVSIGAVVAAALAAKLPRDIAIRWLRRKLVV